MVQVAGWRRWNGLEIREQVLHRLVAGLRIMLDGYADNHGPWVGNPRKPMRGWINQRRMWELAETFTTW